ncbi:MAG: hypothetical protein GXP32_01945 [Kiritimatiellaeota bacterium]|nr:hypothetical protein [Kiritimatiellota bacterium]
MIEFECVHCNTQISIDPDQMISPELICPACGTIIDMPDLPPEMKAKLEEMAESAKMSDEEADDEVAEAVLEQPPSTQATMWREKLAESFQTANQANVADSEDTYDDRKSKLENLVETFLDYFSIRNHEGFIKYHDSVSSIGQYSILAAGVLALLKSGMLASTSKQPEHFIVFGLSGLIASCVLSYLAAKFSRLTVAVIHRTELTFYTYDLLYSFGLIALALIPMFLFLGVYVVIANSSIFSAVMFVVGAIVALHTGILFLSPIVLNSKVGKHSSSPGETGIAFLGYMIRVVLLLSGFLLAVAPVLLVVLVFVLFDKNTNANTFLHACAGLAFVALAPMVSYFVYLAYRIVLDLYNTIFTIAKTLSVFIDSLYSEEQE